MPINSEEIYGKIINTFRNNDMINETFGLMEGFINQENVHAIHMQSSFFIPIFENIETVQT